MTAARRWAVLAAAMASLMLLALPRSQAQEPAQSGPWRVTDWSAPPTGPVAGPVTVSGTIHYDIPIGQITEVTLQLTRTEPRTGCPELVTSEPQAAHPDDDDDEPPAPGTTPTTSAADPREFDFSISVLPPCNGTYRAAVVALHDDSGPPVDEEEDDDPTPRPIPQEDEEGDPVEHVVAAPPPDVAAVISSVTGRTIRVAWQPPAGYGPTATSCTTAPPTDRPDFTGYLVQREAAGAWTTLPNGALPVGTHCLEHQEGAEVPSGTNIRYRVLAVRDSPAGPVTAAGGSTAVVTVVVDPPAPTTTATTRAPRAPSAPSRGGRGADGGTASGTVPPLPDDGTFDEELDYGEPGEEAAVIPDDADTFLDFVPSPGPGILVPFAIAECLAVWAFHLRYLARRADDGF